MTMTTDDLWQSNFTDHLDVAQATRAELFEPFERLLSLSIKAIQGGGKLLFFGNGGSAADAQHLATELSVRYVDDRPPIAAIALTTDGSALTAIGNDMGFEALFARQIEALGRAGDVAIGISTSGRSRNVIRGLEQARTQGLVAAAFSGRDGGDLVGLAEPLLIVPATVTARIQEMHITLGHILCDGLERGLGLVDRL
jgi:D-sedoheptulose 7-phosphate isomerase